MTLFVLRCIPAALCLLLLGLTSANQFQPFMTPQQLIDVGLGRHINLYCAGSGSPTVILDSDTDDSTLVWRFVQPAIAKSTRVCSYDAAGVGFSDPAPAPRDAAAYARDLSTLTKRASLRPPYVLVGFGFSGLSTRLFADLYPNDVAAMVLVDPLVPYRNRQIAALVPALAPLAHSDMSGLEKCRSAAVAGKLHLGTPVFESCMWPTGPGDPSLPEALRKVLLKQWQRPESWSDLISTGSTNDASSDEVVREQRSYGMMPLIVLTSDVDVDMKGMPLSPKQIASIGQAYATWHKQIAHLSSRGSESVVKGSSENMPLDHAQSVISAIELVLRELRLR
jgi:pimeloyl-ACP methyl ester carboxylesterase